MGRSDLSGFDLVVVAVAAVSATAVAVVWSGAALAAVLGGDPVAPSLDHTAEALTALPAHLTDPAAAWPSPAGGRLPGPVPYWTATAVTAATLGTLVAMAIRRWSRSRVGTARREPLGVDGRARFARHRDLTPLRVRGPQPGRFLLGRVGRHLVATEDRRRGPRRARGRQGDRGAVALVGPSRSGKTTAVVSGILEWDGPAVLSSVKSDLLAATHGWRGRLGDVVVYDPTGTTGVASAAWSPLRAADTVIGAQRAARALCDAAPRGGVEGGLDFWLVQAEILLSALLWVAHHSGHDMATVAEWVMTQDRPGEHGPGEIKPFLDGLLDAEDDTVAAEATQTALSLLSIWEMEERTRSSVYATAQTVTWPWADPGVAAASRGHSIDLDWLLSGTNTVYLSAPIEDQQRLAPAFGGVINDLVKQAYLRVAATGKPLDPPLLVVVDEAGNTPLRSMPEYASTLAGIGVLLVTVWQSVAQIEAVYHRQADTILTNHLSKVFYAGLSDVASLRYVAQVLGDAEVDTVSSGVNPGAPRPSLNLATTHQPLAPAHALRQMRGGDALLVHGTLPPAHLRTRPYYRDRRLAARAALRPGPMDREPHAERRPR